MSVSEAEHLLEEIAPDWLKQTAQQLDENPVVVMEFQGRNPDQKIRVVVPPPATPLDGGSWSNSSVDLISEKIELPAKARKGTPSQAKMLSPSPKPSRERKVGGQNKKQVKEEVVEIPNSYTVIKMQMSGTVGKPFAYGSGLPESQQSYLTVTSQTDL